MVKFAIADILADMDEVCEDEKCLKDPMLDISKVYIALKSSISLGAGVGAALP